MKILPIIQQKYNFKAETLNDNTQIETPKQTVSSSKDIFLGAGLLASLAIAGVALYKNKNMKQELNSLKDNLTKSEKTVEEMKAKLKEAEKKIPQVEEKKEAVKPPKKEKNNDSRINSLIAENNRLRKALEQTVKKAEETINGVIKEANDVIKSQQGKRKSQGKQKEDSSIRKRALFNKENVIVIAPSKRHKHVQGENVIDIRELAEQSKDVTKESGFGLRTIFRNIQQKYYEILVNYRAKQAQKLKNQDIKELDKKYRQAVEASDARNAEWLNEQHKLKEAEYAKLFDEADIREGERILDAEAASSQAYIKASDARNEEWLKKQHELKEKEYAKLFDDAELAEQEKLVDDMARKMDDEALVRTKRLNQEDIACQEAIKAGDARNEEWLKKQHELKEKEYAKLFDDAELAEQEKLVDDMARKMDEEALVRTKRLNQEDIARQEAIKAGDARNEEWLKKQHELKEKEYAKLFDDAELAEQERLVDDMARKMDEEALTRAKHLEQEDIARQEAIKASDARNEEWLKKQHELKEIEYNKLFEKLPEDSKTEESQNIEQFNEEMRRYLQDNGLGLVKSNKLGKDMPPSYRKTGAMIPDSIEKLKFIFKKLRNRNHVLRQKNHIIYKRMQKGCWDKDAALKTRLLVYPEEVQKKMHEKRYHQMSGWTDAQWDEAKITRKDFMENKGKYILEELGLD